MNIVVLVDPGAEGVDVRGALRGVGLNEITATTTWDALMQTVVETRPDMVVLVHRALQREGDAALKAADWALRPLKIPVMIALGRDEADLRYQIEMTTEFEYFVIEPFDLEDVRNIVTDAVGHNRWQSVTREVSVVEEISFDVQGEVLDDAFDQLFDSGAPPVVDPTRVDEPDATTPFAFDADDDGTPDSVGSAPVADPRAPIAPPSPADEPSGPSRPERPRVGIATPVVGSASTMPPQPADTSQDQRTIARMETTQVAFRIPDPAAGELGHWRVPHLLAVLAERRATGTLRLTRERVRREIVVFDGRPGARDVHSTMVERSRLLSTFAWTSGTWVFVPDSGVSRTSFMPYAGGYEFIWEGICRTLSMNDAASLLTPHLKAHAVHTDRVQLLKGHAELQRLRELLERFVGDEPFERQMMHLGVPPDEVLRAAWFGEVIGAVAFCDGPTAPPVVARVEEVHGSESASDMAVGSGADASDAGRAGAPSGASAAVDPAVVAAIDELNATWAEFSSMGAFELFGLSAGDDESALTERYYEMVREYHPDRYARVNDPQVRSLAEKIFLHIRAQYARARAGETGPRKAVGPGARASSPADGRAPERAPQPSAASAARPAPAPNRPDAASRPAEGQRPAPASPPSVSGSGVTRSPGRRRPVSQVLEDLRRKRTTGSSPVVGAADSGSFSRVSEGASVQNTSNRRSTGSRLLSPDQLLRNAVKALETGAVDKASDHLALGRSRGGEGFMYDGVEEYVGYLREQRTARHVIKKLKDLSEDAARDWEKSVLLLFKGHVHRLEEEYGDALKAYSKARQLDEANLSAQRWERHAKMRAKKPAKQESLLDKLRNTKITLGKGK